MRDRLYGLAIDPGPQTSAVVTFSVPRVPTAQAWTLPFDVEPHGYEEMALGEFLERMVRRWAGFIGVVAIEKMAGSYGSGRVGNSTMDTQWNGGAFAGISTCLPGLNGSPIEIFTCDPQERRLAVLGAGNTKDAHLRAALEAVYGGKPACYGMRCKRCKGSGLLGKKAQICPNCKEGWIIPKGPLNGFKSSHSFSALAVAICWSRRRIAARQLEGG